MGKIPQELRQIIARNIRACREKRYPGHGGGKKCAQAFGTCPQQRSPWERGIRTPDELRLRQIAEFFGVSVAYLREDHRAAEHDAGSASTGVAVPVDSSPDTTIPPPPEANLRCPFYSPPKPGQPFSSQMRSPCWLVERLFDELNRSGLPIRLHPEDMEKVMQQFFRLKQPPQ